MKKILSFGFVLLGGVVLSPVCAQLPSIAKQRFIVDEALSTIEDYKSFATISDEEIRYYFEELFVDGNAKIYNDLLGVSTAESLSVKEYSQKLSEGLRNKKATITNVKKEEIWNENGSWKIKFSFDKTLSYVNKCGTYFSSNEFYDKAYHLVATLVYDEQQDKCKIESITGSVDSSKKLPDGFFTFKTEDKRDYQLIYRNNKLSFNNYGQMLLDGAFDRTAFRYADPDVELIPIVEEECKSVSMKYKTRNMRLKLHYDLGMGEAFDLADADDLNDNKTSSSSFGIDFGYVFPSKGNLKTGLFVGIGFTQSTIELSYQNSDYYYDSNADVDGDTYVRHYQNFHLNQTAKLTELNVPVYLDFNLKPHQLVSLYLDLGAKVNLNVGHKVDAFEGGADDIYGIYKQYDNLRLDGNWGYNGFGKKVFTDSDFDDLDLTSVASMTVDLLGEAGIRVNIPNTPLDINVGANYQLGIMDLISPEKYRADLFSGGRSPLIYNTISGPVSREHVRNLVETASSIKRKSFKLSIGVILKF